MARTQIKGVQIKDDDITSNDIADAAVRGATANAGTQREIATGTISDVDIRNAAITPSKIDSSGSFSMNVLTLSATSSQLTLGTTNTTTLSATAPTASRTYTLPDTGTNSSFVMTDGTQTINGVKSFSSNITLSAVGGSINLNGGGGSSAFIDFYPTASGQNGIFWNGTSTSIRNGANGTISVGTSTLTISPFASPTTTFNSSGITLSAGQFFAPNGSTASPSISFTNSTGSGFSRTGTNIISFSTAGVEVLRVDASQNTDFLQHQVKQLVVHLLSTDPVSPTEGQIWYNTTTHQWSGYNGTTNVLLG